MFQQLQKTLAKTQAFDEGLSSKDSTGGSDVA